MNTSPTTPPNTGDTDWLEDLYRDAWLNGADRRKEMDRWVKGARAAIEQKLTEIEKAYGGCHKCYGKGYATVIASMDWSDTDTDIGSSGASGHSDRLTMRYCTCERGKQLESLQASKEGK